MPWGAIIGGVIAGGASMYGASQQAGAAQTAAGQQEAAALAEQGLNANIFNATAGMQLPTRELGGEAQSRLAYLLGLDPNLNIGSDFSTPNLSVGPNGQTSLNWNGTGSAPGSAPQLFSNVPNYNGAGTPGSVGGSGAGGGTAAPPAGTWSTGFGNGTGTSAGAAGGFGSLSSIYNPSTFYQDPGYNFVQQQTQLALSRAGAASGQTGSGAQLEAAMNYASGLASQEFNNAFARSESQQQLTFNELSGLAGTGQAATGAVGAAGGNALSAGSSALAGFGNAGAAGTIGAGNAWGSGYNSLGGIAGSLGSLYTMNNTNYNPNYNNSNYGVTMSNPAFNGGGMYTNSGGYTFNVPYSTGTTTAPQVPVSD